MPNPYFSFKQFTVHHDRCAMKVGTDGVLLGAWADVSQARRVLDIGTGTGLIALMLAQRSAEARITAIDIDADAVGQARENVTASPWADRITVEQQDLCRYHADERFDLIVSNPPYFNDSLKCPDAQRATARHTDGLDFHTLITQTIALLTENGRFAVIIPTDGMPLFMEIALREGLHLHRRTLVRTKPDAAPKRVLLSFGRSSEVETVEDELVVELARHEYSEEYIALTRDFYLKM